MKTKNLKQLKKIGTGAAIVLLAGTMVASQVFLSWSDAKSLGSSANVSESKGITQITDKVDTGLASKFDSSVVYALPDSISSDREISLIVKTTEDALLAAYASQSGVTAYDDINDFALSKTGLAVSDSIARANRSAKALLEKTGVKFKYGSSYDMLLGGFEVVITAKDYETLASSLDGSFEVFISEEYLPAETQVVNNDVNVYGTGIFDSSESEYDGTGTLIAVLDTGLDYTHTAFDPANMTASDSDVAIRSAADLASKVEIRKLRAAEATQGLRAADVYLNKRVPYAYDYADKDPDVFPIENQHGTHVSGVILGKDDTITGVAPNAQLASMKVFSDTTQGARQSWILTALEDCVRLDVDVINMSLGSSCGFSEEAEAEQARVYREVGEHGISLVAAASNDYTSTYNSEKNGNLGLTSNPDTATVGSPSTYLSSLSVASISGVKTPYLTYGKTIIYFNEANNAAAKQRDFVNEILPAGVNEKEFEYVLIPGIGRSADYQNTDVKGKIALVSRGSNTFEDKARIAQQQGAAGIIIFNNVSGDILMTVGRATLPVCSISKDNGYILKEAGRGTIKISRSQVAGPFMSDFSSWGPTSDLRIKPEITAHGGEILSAVPGQSYDRLSGTSMASPNQAGVTALIRQYVKEKFPGMSATDAVTRRQVTALVNQIMMSTTDIARNTNGLDYFVRKQGSGLANLTKATSTPAYLTTFERDDNDLYSGSRYTDTVMDKTKIEVGDDPDKTGVYELKFAINNVFGGTLSYEVSADVLTEGVSETLTDRGDTTVNQLGYALGAKVVVTSVTGGSQSGNTVTVQERGTAVVTVTITLSDDDKDYLNASFANGMYVEGFVRLKAVGGTTIDLNAPFLAFYGDWLQAPIFDLDYFETDKDANDPSVEADKKIMADATPTRPIGGLYDDYISYLGSYYFVQDPSTTRINADRNHISLTNQHDGINSVYAVWAGMLRNAKKVVTTITDSTTGEVVETRVKDNVRKSYNYSGSITSSNIDIKFNVADYDLKNNTKYTVKLEAYMDYADGGINKNVRNTFEFEFTTDFLAPVVTDAQFYTEYDRSAEKNRLYARIYVYDNHYAMSLDAGYIYQGTRDDGNPGLMLASFKRLPTQIYSEFNSTTEVVIELTDYYDKLSKRNNPDLRSDNVLIVSVTDYALNQGVYEIPLPDNILDIHFDEESLTLNPNETYALAPKVWPGQLQNGTWINAEWAETLVYESSNENVARVVNGKVLAVGSGDAVITVRSNKNPTVTATLPIHVRGEGEEGYVGNYSKPVLDTFRITGFTVDKAFYFLSSSDREIGLTGSKYLYSSTQSYYYLSMYPSEAVTMEYELDAYFPDNTEVVFTSGNTDIVKVEGRKITAVAEGTSSVSVQVLMDGKGTLYDATININVKNPYETNASYLMSYRGNGGKVVIPDDLSLTQIYQYAFSLYDYVPKDLENGDEISDEDPYHSKIWYVGENTITEVVIPEGVEQIGAYAFAGLTALEKVKLPSTLKKIDVGAFYMCSKLKTVEGLENVQFINQDAFNGTKLDEASFGSIIAIGNRAFMGTKLRSITLPASAQSIGISVFEGSELNRINIQAVKVKLGVRAFAQCGNLSSISINASVLPDGVFDGCNYLSNVTIGADVESIGMNAFRGTKVSSFSVAPGNKNFGAQAGGSYLLSADGTELVLVAPTINKTFILRNSNVTRIGDSAFSNAEAITIVEIPTVTAVGDHAFDGCKGLRTVTLGTLTEIGEYAFANTNLLNLPSLDALADKKIPAYAFYNTKITSITVPDGFTVGQFAFAANGSVTDITVGNNVNIGDYAFAAAATEVSAPYSNSLITIYTVSNTSLRNVTLGNEVTIGEFAFSNAFGFYLSNTVNGTTIVSTPNATLKLGNDTRIGAGAFYNAGRLATIENLEGAVYVGDGAFYGELVPVITEYGSLYAYLKLTHGAKITSVNLPNATYVGDGAFENCALVESAVLSGELKAVGALAFYGTALKSIDLGGVTKIGEAAFYRSSLESLDLSLVEEIGAYAFAYSALTGVTLKAGVVIGGGAFANCENLASIGNLDKVVSIGAYAFTGVAITKADLSSAETIGDFAFLGVPLTGVVLGEKLENIGDNPFAESSLPSFSMTVEQDFYGNKYETELYDFDISATVKVIDGVLYKSIPNGLALVTYPTEKAARDFTVAEGTVRISARAFENAKLVSVQLPVSLGSIGDKAFYGCKKLAIVTFKSIVAPILEEQYDEMYTFENYNYLIYDENGPITDENGWYYTRIPGKTANKIFGDSIQYHTLDIIKYAVWNIGGSNFFYGANFVDYIGYADGNLVMIRPHNGTGYDSFLYRQYFSETVDGQTAPDAITQAAIAAIAKIPDANDINLTHEPIVVAARAAYDLISSNEQKALVYNYERLTAAENIIEFLKPKPEDKDPDPVKENNPEMTAIIVLSVFLGIFVIAAGALAALVYLKARKPKAEAEKTEGAEGADAASEGAEGAEPETAPAEGVESEAASSAEAEVNDSDAEAESEHKE